MLRREFKFTFVILLVATVVWSLACYLQVQAYNKYIREETERYISIGFSEEQVRGYIDFKPFLYWGLSSPLFIIGFFLIMAWTGFLSELYRLKKRKVKT